jgi:hypothetical protein
MDGVLSMPIGTPLLTCSGQPTVGMNMSIGKVMIVMIISLVAHAAMAQTPTTITQTLTMPIDMATPTAAIEVLNDVVSSSLLFPVIGGVLQLPSGYVGPRAKFEWMVSAEISVCVCHSSHLIRSSTTPCSAHFIDCDDVIGSK